MKDCFIINFLPILSIFGKFDRLFVIFFMGVTMPTMPSLNGVYLNAKNLCSGLHLRLKFCGDYVKIYI
jgi:hypothetical protein